MTALTEDQEVYARRQIGSAPDDVTLQAIFDRLEPQHGNSPAVDFLVLEVLETRYADLIRNPAQFAIPGDYSQSTAENIKALEKKIAAWRAWMTSQGLDPGPTTYGSTLTFVAPEQPAWR